MTQKFASREPASRTPTAIPPIAMPPTVIPSVAHSLATYSHPLATHPRILLIEDEESYVQALEVGLRNEGMKVVVARDGKEALDTFDEAEPDLILLDLMLPKINGIDVCREIRKRSSVPILMVTAKSEELDVVVGLEMGADDYITKPYRLKELVARIRVQLRRQHAPANQTALTSGDLRIDPNRHEVCLRGKPLKLPLKEFDLLWVLMMRKGQVVTRDRLIHQVWGADYVSDTKTLDVHIQRLRSKIEGNPSKPKRLINIRGVGYKLVE